MGRRYSVATYLRRLAPLQEEFNLTSDVIVGFPTEDERAFANTLRAARAAGLTKVHVFPYSPRPGTLTAHDDPVSPQVKRSAAPGCARSRDEACRARWRTQGRPRGRRSRRPRPAAATATTTRRGSSAAPPVGELVRVRGAAVTEEGVLAA